MSSGRLVDALHSLLDWLAKAEAYLVEDQPVYGDLDTVNILIEKHKVFQEEVASRRSLVETMRSNPGLEPEVRKQLEELTNVWDRVQELSDVRESKLQESLKLAEQFSEVIQVIRDWLPEAESELKFQPIPEDEDSIVQLMENHDKFQEELRSQQSNIERIRCLAEEILQSCHPNAVRFVKYYLTITQTRWEQAISRSNQRSQRLQEALRNARTNMAMLEELMAWLADGHALLSTKEKDSIPDDLTVVEALVKEQEEFHEDLTSKAKDVEKLVKSLSSSVVPKKPTRQSMSKPTEAEILGPRASALQNRWRIILRMSNDRNKKLTDILSRLLETESFKNFDFDAWRQRYVTWNRANKSKYMDFFRRQDKQGSGMVSRKEFVDGILASRFPTNVSELNAVFSLFDSNRLGKIKYKVFVDSIMRPDKPFVQQKPGSQPVSDAELIQMEMEDQLSRCQCRNQFGVVQVDVGKYKFGDKDKVSHVRLLNSAVFVRFGCGWMPFEEFLDNNDPCRVKIRAGSTTPRSALNSRLSGSASNLLYSKQSAPHTPTNPSPGLATKNTYMTKSWSNLASTPISTTNSRRTELGFSTTPRSSTSNSRTSLYTAPPRIPPRTPGSTSITKSHENGLDRPDSKPPELFPRAATNGNKSTPTSASAFRVNKPVLNPPTHTMATSPGSTSPRRIVSPSSTLTRSPRKAPSSPLSTPRTPRGSGDTGRVRTPTDTKKTLLSDAAKKMTTVPNRTGTTGTRPTTNF